MWNYLKSLGFKYGNCQLQPLVAGDASKKFLFATEWFCKLKMFQKTERTINHEIRSKNGTPSFDTNAISKSKNEDKQYPQLTDEQMNEYFLTGTKAAHLESLASSLFFLRISSFFLLISFFSSFTELIGIIITVICWASGLGCLVNTISVGQSFLSY